MQAIPEITLAILISLSGHFNQGLTHFQEKAYPEAIEALTLAINTQPSIEPLRAYALYYRGLAYLKADQQQAGLKDLMAVIFIGEPEHLRVKALKLFKEAGGDRKDLLPRFPPKTVFSEVVNAGKRKDQKAMVKHFTPEFLGMLETIQLFLGIRMAGAGEDHNMLFDMARELEKADRIEETIDLDANRASLRLEMDRDPTLVLGLVQQNNTWKFNRVLDLIPPENEHLAKPVRPSAANQLRQIGMALFSYAADYNKALPDDLGKIKPYLKDESLLAWEDPQTQKPMPILYRKGLALGAGIETMLAAQPVPAGGHRLVLFMDAHVESLAEEVFIKRALEQKWLEAVPREAMPVNDKLRKTVDQLVRQMETGNYKERGEAREMLESMRKEIYPILDTYRDHEDPEIRMTIRELLQP